MEGRQLRMVIDASELGLEAVFYSILGLVVGVVVLGFAIAVLAARLGGRTLGFASVGFGLVVVVGPGDDDHGCSDNHDDYPSRSAECVPRTARPTN